MIFIQSKKDGFRRCGVAHSAAGKEFDDDFFTKKQLEELAADPDIIMVAGDAPKTEPGTETDLGEKTQEAPKPKKPKKTKKEN